MKRERDISGFTLIELMIVISILGIIGSVVAKIVFAEQIHAWEDEHLSPFIRALIFLFVCAVLYFRFLDEKKQARKEGKPVVRKQVWWFVFVSIIGVVSFLLWRVN